MAESSQIPFRLLNLPAEVRLIVYGHIPITTRHYTLRYAFPISSVTLVIRSLSTPLLATCRLIYTESRSILDSKKHHLRQTPTLYYLVSKTQLPAFRLLTHTICTIENVARQQNWEAEEEVTITSPPPPAHRKKPSFNEAETAFIIKCVVENVIRDLSSSLLFVRNATLNNNMVSRFFGMDSTITKLTELPWHMNRRVEMKFLARHGYRDQDWGAEVARLRHDAQGYGAVFDIPTDGEEDECERGEVVEMGYASGPPPPPSLMPREEGKKYYVGQ